MKKDKLLGAISFLVVLVGLYLSSSAQDSETRNNQDSAALYRKETRIFHSDIMNDAFEIQVSLPAVYYQTDTTFPVLFSTDANRNFGIISDLVNALTFPQNYIPNLVVVGIGYPIAGLEEWAARRHNDLTPSYDSVRSKAWNETLSLLSGRDDLEVKSGQAENFLLFLKDELIPFVEKEYRVNKDNRGIAGYSLGGLFTLYTMLKSPETFNYYFAGSPSLRWGDDAIFKIEKEYAKNHDNLNARAYMSIGEHEQSMGISKLKEMEYILQSRNYPGLKLKTKIFPDEIHQTCYPPALNRALIYLYSGDQVR